MKYLITPLLFFICTTLNSQVIVYDGNAFTIDYIEEDIVEKLIKTVRTSIQNYNNWATLVDQQKKEVTTESLQKFKSLFERNAQIVDDISKSTEKLNYADYAGKVFEFLGKDGVRYNIYGAMIDQISYDSAGYYEVDVLSEKYVYNGLESDNKPFYCRNGRIFRIKFTFHIPKEKLDVAKINRIKGELARDCEDRVPVYSFGLQAGTMTFDNSANDFFKNNLADINWRTTPQFQFGADLGFQYPIDKRDRVFFILGASYRKNSFENLFSGSYSKQAVDAEGIPFDRFVQFTALKEKVNADILQIPIGFRINFFNKDPLYIFVDANFGINIPFNSTGEIDMNIVYSGVYPDGTTEIFSLEDGMIRPEFFSSSLEPQLKTNYFLEFGPTLQYVLGNDFALQIGLKYQLGLTSWYEHEATPFYVGNTGSTIWEGSLSEVYAKESKTNSFGIQIGFIYKKRW